MVCGGEHVPGEQPAKQRDRRQAQPQGGHLPWVLLPSLSPLSCLASYSSDVIERGTFPPARLCKSSACGSGVAFHCQVAYLLVAMCKTHHLGPKSELTCCGCVWEQQHLSTLRCPGMIPEPRMPGVVGAAAAGPWAFCAGQE